MKFTQTGAGTGTGREVVPRFSAPRKDARFELKLISRIDPEVSAPDKQLFTISGFLLW